jgi:N-acetylneuraminic acid mutarotase
VVAVAEKIYAVGGRFNTFEHNTDLNDVYDPATNAWFPRAPMPTARSGAAAAVMNGQVLVFGGERLGGTFTETEAYDSVSNTWTSLTAMPSGRHGTGAAVIGNLIYVPAGAPVNGGSQQSATNLVFTLA